MDWLYLMLAGCFEVVGVIGMNKVVRTKNFLSFSVLFAGFACSFSLLGLAMKTLPLGISYAVWTGIGTVGGTLVGMFCYGEAKDCKRLLFIFLIVVSVLGLKLVS